MRSKAEMDVIIQAGTSAELNDSAFWQEYDLACKAAKGQPSAPAEEEPAAVGTGHVKKKHNPARLGVPRDEFGNPLRHVDIHDPTL